MRIENDLLSRRDKILVEEGGVLLLSATESWQELVRGELGDVEVGYNEAGAPIINGQWSMVNGQCVKITNYIPQAPDPIPHSQFSILNSQLSVSHTEGLTAVLLAQKPCGVDVERQDRDFGRVGERYLSPQERALSDEADYLCAAWCAREAVYKLVQGRRGEGLMARMRIVAATESGISVEFDGHIYMVSLVRHGEYLIAWTVGN